MFEILSLGIYLALGVAIAFLFKFSKKYYLEEDDKNVARRINRIH